MKELSDIVQAYSSVGEFGPTAVLATLVKTEGLCYRSPGARMLLIEGGHQAGLLSGRNIEKALHERARKVSASGHPETCSYQTEEGETEGGAAEAAYGVGIVLLEPLSGQLDELPIRVLRECLQERRHFRMGTVFSAPTDAAAHPGSRIVFSQDGSRTAMDLGEELALRLEKDLLSLPLDALPRPLTYDSPEGPVEVLLEVLLPPPAIAIFGGGLDSCPLVKMSKELGWRASVIDPDPACANKGRFFLADEVVVAHPDQIGDRVSLDERTVAVLATHNFQHDLELLERLLATQAPYVGVVGPRGRAKKLLAALAEKNPTLARQAATRVFAPAGLDIGAQTPQEIALAILAEVRTQLSGSEGGPLRNL